MKTDHRLKALREYMEAEGIVCSLILSPDNQFYLSGFKAVIYSRPILLLIHDDRTSAVVPALEESHARHDGAADDVVVYYEHPELADRGTTHTGHLDEILSKYPRGSRIGIEAGFCPVSVKDHLQRAGFETVDIGSEVARMRFVKDGAEIETVVEAGKLVNLALKESLAALREGVTEIDVDARGNAALFEKTAEDHPDATLDVMAMSPSGVERTIMPHVFSNTRRMESRDIMIHSRQVALNGYRAELERTIFIGEPTEEQARAFEAAMESQRVAMDLVKPGITAREVDDVSRQVFRDAGFEEFAIHRVGHGLGISAHEEPYLRFDNDLVLEEGMIYSIEPGIYVPGLGGFRHSDTVVVTASGNELVTEYPRDLASLVVG